MSDPLDQIELWTKYERDRCYSADLAGLIIGAHQARRTGATEYDARNPKGYRVIISWATA